MTTQFIYHATRRRCFLRWCNVFLMFLMICKVSKHQNLWFHAGFIMFLHSLKWSTWMLSRRFWWPISFGGANDQGGANEIIMTHLLWRCLGSRWRKCNRCLGRMTRAFQGSAHDVHLVDRSKPIKFHMQIAILRPLLGQIRFKGFGCAQPSSAQPSSAQLSPFGRSFKTNPTCELQFWDHFWAKSDSRGLLVFNPAQPWAWWVPA